MSHQLYKANDAYYKYCKNMLTHGDAVDYKYEWQEAYARLTPIQRAYHERFCADTYEEMEGNK